MRGQRVAIDAALERGRPTPERRHTRAAFVWRHFAAAHPGVVNVHAERPAVVGQENQQGVVLNAPVL